MARRVTALEQARRKRWASFLQPIVGSEKEVSVVKLDQGITQVLGEARSSGSDDRRAIYDYLGGKRTPSANSAWNTGEALHAVGTPWCSGLLGLWAAGYFEHYASALGAIWRKSPRASIELLYSVPLAVDSAGHSTVRSLKAPHAHARALCQNHSGALRDLFPNATTALRAPTRHSHDPLVFDVVHDVVRAMGSHFPRETEVVLFFLCDRSIRIRPEYSHFYHFLLTEDRTRREWRAMIRAAHQQIFGSDPDLETFGSGDSSFRDVLFGPVGFVEGQIPSPPITLADERRRERHRRRALQTEVDADSQSGEKDTRK